MNAAHQAEARAARHANNAASSVTLVDATRHAHASATAAKVAQANAEQWPTPEAKTSAKRAARHAARAVQIAANIAHANADKLAST